VDIGCGLGEVLRHLHAPNRIGMDICEKCLQTARLLDKSNQITFSLGSLNELKLNDPIDYVITLAFMHGGREDVWKDTYHNCAANNDIKAFIVDVLPEDGTTHHLDFELILPDNYVLKDKLGPFLSGRFLHIYEKKD